MKERERGALLGLACGDALGTTYEFARIDQARYPVLAAGPATDIVGNGPFALAPGQVTDDTQMAVCLARSLRDRRALDLEDIGARYVAWSAEAFDIGNQTGSALGLIEGGRTARDAGLVTWRASGHRAAGNGSLMRTTPIAVAVAPELRVEAAILESMITHADPRCALACAAFDEAVAAAIAGTPELIEVARTTLASAAIRMHGWFATLGADAAEQGAIDEAHAALDRDLTAALADDPDVYGAELDVHRTAGFVRVAFRLAFWHAHHTPSWRAAVVDVASRGGDADTNAAIVGALLGARDGERAIPAAWRERVLGARQRGSEMWSQAHHPLHLLALVGD